VVRAELFGSGYFDSGIGVLRSLRPLLEIGRGFEYPLVLVVAKRPHGLESSGDLRDVERNLHRIGQAEQLHADLEALLRILDLTEGCRDCVVGPLRIYHLVSAVIDDCAGRPAAALGVREPGQIVLCEGGLRLGGLGLGQCGPEGAERLLGRVFRLFLLGAGSGQPDRHDQG
jgi:hypothetical protein